ncbi:LytR/AlgR family response regulator transcription factor [Christiangramia flava]|uniref:Two-component system response regulator n=1 Tax=Christiangramia flava JLT2011 TaxID=1229726 RepID=A0A1L7I7N7_9FLAO|nr:LytTR family DNA-binding domain-containing protein [Christiangramia flava]APU69621.1 Two-component system response regulator [Christiangramia flava JLT2011]OSS39348.1 Two-component system response regulator [Christiangramia flava JLT2011]
MTAIIIEDERPAARRLQRMLGRIGLETDVMLHSVAEAVNWLSANKDPDLIFLDIQLSDGVSFEIFEHVKVQSAIIFTTAYDEYALQAFKVNSIDYLLKPIDEEELKAAIEKYQTNFEKRSEQVEVGKLQELLGLKSSKTYRNRFTAQVGQHLKLINTSEISCFYSENKATYIQSQGGRNYLLDQSLENLEKELDPEVFFRVSRKHIINIRAIEDIISYTNSRLELKLAGHTDSQVIVSRERVKDFKTWLEH